MSFLRFIVEDDHHWQDMARRLDQLTHDLQELRDLMTPQLAALQTEVAAMHDVIGSAIALLNGLAAQIATLKDDPIALQALADGIHADSASLAASVVADTPAENPQAAAARRAKK